jgi:hypothetical protein
MPFYYGPTPTGFPLTVPGFAPYQGPLEGVDLLNSDIPPALVVTEVAGRTITVRNIGRDPVDVPRPPAPGDYVFPEPTRTNAVFLALWGIVPNLHFFWLVDSVALNRPVPPLYLGLIGAYGAVQIAAWLALGIILFQKRDVG